MLEFRRNQLLRALSSQTLSKLCSSLVTVELPERVKLSRPGDGLQNIIFPHSGVASVVGNVTGAWQELGMLGSEGAVGITSLFTSAPSVNLIVMQIGGVGSSITAAAFKKVFENDAEVRELVLAYTASYMTQISCTAIANVQCNTCQRLGRWLMMVQDRIHSKCVPLTHEYISAMLGISRTSVTIALLKLERDGHITTSRKSITINDREKLRVLVGEYYGTPEAQHEKIMGKLSFRDNQ